jgi:preprotein translocase subunit SecY|tara:strand:+ start:3232 stop:4560 length:1329 start_codon:yes stop_codon:yes gene_type:complete
MANENPLGALGQATELRQRILFTLGALIIYRLGTYIPVPGIDPMALSEIVSQANKGVLGMFNMFSGGALGRMTIFALTIIPYISASIIMQLMTSISPQIAQLKKEGETGRKTINQYTRYLTVLLATVQAWGFAIALEGTNSSAGSLVMNPGVFFKVTTVVTLVGGVMFLLWLGEQITERGIGNGVSLLIFAGIVAELPRALVQILEQGRTGAISTFLIVTIFFLAIAVIAFIVFIERSQRKIIVQYPKRQVGNKIFSGDASHLPLKINVAGVIPPIFASALLLLPTSISSFAGLSSDSPDWLITINSFLGRGQPLYLAIYISLIVFFAFFYTAIVFNPDETADNLKRNGGFVPGIRPGSPTAEYLDFVLTRLTAIGALYLSAVCILPEILISQYSIPFYFGGTSLLIVVTVSIDTVTQAQSHLIAHQYSGLIRKRRLGGMSR